MTLTTEELGEMPDVDAATVEEILSSDAFGKFVILSASEREFIQAGNDWQPGEECEAFMDEHDSDPWVLEYHKGKKHYRAEGTVTLAQVLCAFQAYRDGRSDWLAAFVWDEIEV